jgi:mannose-6-phosphate isomerase-like protein (cupin superfamily)
MSIKPGVLLRSDHAPVTYRERFTPATANLQFLSCGEYEIQPGARTQTLCYPNEEALLFTWRGHGCVSMGDRGYGLATYDVLYVPKGQPYHILNAEGEVLKIFVTRAPAEHEHPPYYGEFAKLSRDESRIRHLKGKDVFLMFDVSEPADKLVAGYTFFEPYARSWPPHNHTDQEEVYIFLNGRGSMEVYESPETLTFVHNVSEGDAVTIPFLNYHPVFSQELPLEFIWCIAGERYWVGDKNKDFMKGTSESITT